MKTLKQVLMERDELTSQEADDAIQECKKDFMERVGNGDLDADEILMEYFGLEPDYLEDLLD